MRSKTFRMACLLLGVSLSPALGCAHKGPTSLAFPPAADLQVKPKPVLAPEAVGSEAALDRHEIALEAWGEEGWRAVGRICRWAVENGATGLMCPPPPDPG